MNTCAVQVASGDVIILGSDGLWDNVAIHVLLAEVKAAFLGKEGPPQIVRRLTNLAIYNSTDKVRTCFQCYSLRVLGGNTGHRTAESINRLLRSLWDPLYRSTVGKETYKEFIHFCPCR